MNKIENYFIPLNFIGKILSNYEVDSGSVQTSDGGNFNF